MKKIFLLLLIIVAVSTMASKYFATPKFKMANSRKYYFSSSGDDVTGDGSISKPYKSINKLNALFEMVKPGDSILLKRGETFNDATVVIGKSGAPGSPIVIGAYGSGSKPVISSLYTIRAWTKTANNIWESEAIPAAVNSLYIVLENGQNPAGMGRYPNADAPNGGYLTIKSFNGLTSFTDEDLPSSPNWTGASVVIRNERWVTDIDTITNHDIQGHTIIHTASHYKPRTAGVGYFIENSPLTLDQQGEWYYNPSTRKLSIYSDNSPVNVQVATRDNNIICTSKNYITFTDITSNGCNQNNFELKNNAFISIVNCVISNSGNTGIRTLSAKNILIEDNTIINSLNNGIDYGYNSLNGIIRGNIVKNTSLLPGLGQSGDIKGNSLNILSKDLLAEYNHLSNAGYCDIWINATTRGITTDSITIQYNEIDSFNRNKNDGAGIYLTGHAGVSQYARVFRHNYIHDGFTSLEGTNPKYIITYGIYFDSYKVGGNVDSNFFTNCGKAAVFVNARANNISFTGNIFYNNPVSQVDVVTSSADSLNANFKNNIFWTTGSQKHWLISSDKTTIPPGLTIDDNHYINLNTNTLPFKYGKSFSYTEHNFSVTKISEAKGLRSSSVGLTGSEIIKPEFNNTKSPVTIPGNWKDALGNIYTSAHPLVLAPYTGAVLIKQS